MLGADLAYLGTRFVAVRESGASEAYKQMLTAADSGPSPHFLPVVHTNQISGIHANFLRESLERHGIDPEEPDKAGRVVAVVVAAVAMLVNV